jgi:hypothetical protein
MIRYIVLILFIVVCSACSSGNDNNSGSDPSCPSGDCDTCVENCVDPGPDPGPGTCNTHDCLGPHKHIFATSGMFTANLAVEAGSAGTGIDAADSLCQQAATNAGRSGTWKAWISNDNNNAIDRIADTGPWYLYGATEDLVFADKAALTQAPLISIRRDEFGDTIVADNTVTGNEVWTGTYSDGANSGQNCSNWSVGDTTFTGTVGLYSSTSKWSNSLAPRNCFWQNHLYCLEQ